MQFSLAIVAAVFAAGALAHGDKPYPHGNETVTTQIVTAYTTYCPEATTFSHGGTTYTVTEATTLTITPTDCGCSGSAPVTTATLPVPTTPVPTTPVPTTPVTTVTAVPVTSAPPTTFSSAPYGNGTAVAPTSGAASGTGAPTTSTTIAPYTGAAGRTVAGAGLAGLAALAVMAL